MGDLVLKFWEFQAFQIGFFQNCQGVALVVFYRLLEAVPVGIGDIKSEMRISKYETNLKL